MRRGGQPAARHDKVEKPERHPDAVKRTRLPSWEINYVPIDRPPWLVVNRESSDRFKCPGVRKGRGLAYPWADVATARQLNRRG